MTEDGEHEPQPQRPQPPSWLVTLGRVVYAAASWGWLVLGLALGLATLLGWITPARALIWMLVGAAVLLALPAGFGVIVAVSSYLAHRRASESSKPQAGRGAE